ncbi:hypothetical protein FNV43_RR13029 [Rhamnella rubrinervis]|uniref:DUF4216 domain-containing protein n=1 Tax=Rhamnella rubrinervis TaxID=2594499 RepID=A0A8K0MEL4_9ROSA|nr:hypothetical protein FNV43_RR13029 [Rhamnella rubrinervis]
MESDGNVNGLNKVFIFKYDWWEIGHRSRTHVDEYEFLSVNVSRTWYKDDSYILKDGMTWINVRKAPKVSEDNAGLNTKPTAVHGRSHPPQQSRCASSGKGKSTRESVLATRTSPRKRACVRLFGPTEAMEDGESIAEFPNEESQHIPPTGNAPNDHQITNNQDGGHVEEAENEGGNAEMENIGVFEFNKDVVTMSVLDAQMRRSFRTWRYRLYERVKKTDKEEDIVAIKPKHITEEEWMIFLQQSTSLTVDEIFAEVLPSKSAAFRGIGVIPKPNKLRASLEVARLRKELEEYKRREKENNATYFESLKKNQQLKVRLAKMERKVKLLLDLHERQFDSFYRMVADIEGGNDTGNGDTSNEG